MAAKLYPPNIEGTIPAFNGTTIVVPFSLNRTVSKTEISKISLKVKTIQGTTALFDADITTTNYDFDNGTATFSLSSSQVSKLNIGQYYKVQLAFVNQSNITGYYSTVGIVKYTGQPSVTLNGLSQNDYNIHSYTYTMLYSQLDEDDSGTKDTTEKLYSTEFILTDISGDIIVDSGEILHNTNNDENYYEAIESFTIPQELNQEKVYYIYAVATTANGLVVETPKYRVIQGSTVAANLHGFLSAENNFDDGYISVSLIGYTNTETNQEYACKGKYVLSKAAEKDEYTWYDITIFSISDTSTSRHLFDDFTTEQGVKYRYSIQQINSHEVRSDRIYSNEVVADFEDAFLYDGEKQLKIRYNPKVSSFKTDMQEAKSETIGSKYPFIFRNGNISYKEFPISGLISYKMDDNEFFLDRDDIYLEEETHNLTGNNIQAERNFKLKVLDWLNNGEHKLFRSPAEGNYIVRLLNTSLTPMDSLGRMLHTFSSTAYEVADFSYSALLSNNLLSVDTSNLSVMQWSSVELSGVSEDLANLIDKIATYQSNEVPIIFSQDLYSRFCSLYSQYDENVEDYFLKNENNTYVLTKIFTEEELDIISSLKDQESYVTGKINSSPVYSINISGASPGTMIGIQYNSNDDIDYVMIAAGTNSYSADFDNPVYGLYIKGNTSGVMTMSSSSDTSGSFDLIENFGIKDIPWQQWIGMPSKTAIDLSSGIGKKTITKDLVQIIENDKYSLNKIYRMHFKARPLVPIYLKNIEDLSTSDYKTANSLQNLFRKASDTIAYYDMDCIEGSEVDLDNLQEYYVYAICTCRGNRSYYNSGYAKAVLSKTIPLELSAGGDSDDSNFQTITDADGNETYIYSRTYNGEIVPRAPTPLYHIYSDYDFGEYIDEDGNTISPVTNFYLSDASGMQSGINVFNKSQYNNTVTIGDEIIDLTKIEEYNLTDLDNIPSQIFFDYGIIGEMSYQLFVKDYDFESTDSSTVLDKTAYEDELQRWKYFKEFISIKNPTEEQIDEYTEKLYLSSSKTTVEEKKSNIKAILQSSSKWKSLENRIILNLSTLYTTYMNQITTTLYSYEQEVSE